MLDLPDHTPFSPSTSDKQGLRASMPINEHQFNLTTCPTVKLP